jgi:hypothetical protein
MERAVDQHVNDANESANDLGAIEALAKELNRPIAEVRQAYESEFARLKETARVTEYLRLFASRRARERLSHH